MPSSLSLWSTGGRIVFLVFAPTRHVEVSLSVLELELFFRNLAAPGCRGVLPLGAAGRGAARRVPFSGKVPPGCHWVPLGCRMVPLKWHP